MNGNVLLWSVSIAVQVGIVVAFFIGLFAIPPAWVIVIFIILSSVVTSVLMLMMLMARRHGNKIVERQLDAVTIPVFSFGLFSLFSLLPIF